MFRKVSNISCPYVILLILFYSLFAQGSPPTEYLITMSDEANRPKTFEVKIDSSTNLEGIRSLEKYIGAGVTEDFEGNPVIGVIGGKIERTDPTSTHHFRFKFVENTVGFNDMTPEVCDATFDYIENRIEQIQIFIGFCPWSTSAMINSIVKNGNLLWKRK